MNMFEYARVNEKKWKKEKNFEWDASVKTNNRMVLSKIRNDKVLKTMVPKMRTLYIFRWERGTPIKM